MNYKIRTTRRAESDIDAKVSWLTNNASARAAERWQTGLIAKVHTLASQPERCPLSDDAADLGIELRELQHGRRPHVYRILFTITGDAVVIHRVRHAAQDRLGDDDF